MRLYDYPFKSKKKTLNRGFDYTDEILPRNLSNVIYRNPILRGFVNRIEDAVSEMINMPKKFRITWIYSLNKNETDFN